MTRMKRTKPEENKPTQARPGSKYTEGAMKMKRKVSWGWKDIKGFPEVTFTPEKSETLTWNGLTLNVFEGIEVTVPDCFYTMYQERHPVPVKSGVVIIGGRPINRVVGIGFKGMSDNPERQEIDLLRIASDLERRNQ